MTPAEWTRVKAIASEAAERPDAERLAFVTSACAGDEHLLREVTSLVAAMAAAGDRLEPPHVSFDDELTALPSLSGTRVGAYEILSPIGAGGMGEVYKARDTRLNRVVAIKLLPARASGDAVSRERMSREARAVAALNHAHICTIHDVGVHDGRGFFVMEYLDGETLASRLARGWLPVPEALRSAGQIASALDEAHRAGIVHRDVKPANIMLVAGRSPDLPAHAKLLDFGIAKASKAEPGPLTIAADGAAAPGLTVWGAVPGTAHYVAPEVLDGVPADARADVFALGAVLFEMLTGRKAFEGSDRAEVLAAVRGADVPRPSTLRAELPAALDRIVLRCLQRDPDARYQSMHGLLDDLRTIERRIDSSPRRRVLTAAAVLTVAILGAAAWAIWPGRAGADIADPTITRLPASAGVQGAPALSPDGSSLVFSWADETLDNPELMLLRLGTNEKIRLTTDPGVEEWPVWSPDGSTIAFVRCGDTGCGLFTRPIGPGGEQKLRNLRRDRYHCLAWAPDGRSLVYTERGSDSQSSALFVLSLDTLAVRQLTSPPPGASEFRFAFSPDGRSLAAIRVGDRIGVHVLSAETGAGKALLSGQREWFGAVTWSADGRHLILSGNQQGVRRLWRLAVAGGDLEPLTIAGEDAYFPTISADGRRLIFVRDFRDWDIARIGLSAGRVTSATPFPGSARIDLDPSFSPDGRKLAFVSERTGTREVWVSNADGSGAVRLTSLNGVAAGRPSWSPDGEDLAFQAGGINVIPAAGGPARKISDDGEAPSWSADGGWIYFMRDVGGYGIWKVPAEGGAPVQVVESTAIVARESPDGAYLYYARLPGGIWRRPVTGGGETPVVEDFTWTLPGYWALRREGIYYAVREQQRDNTFVHHLRFYDFATRRSSALGTLPGNTDNWVGGLTVSPDGRTLLYTQRAYQSTEIVMIEPFR